ncbi:MAG: helix-turn-helix domain-containing protein [Acetobacteraceae bacterium]
MARSHEVLGGRWTLLIVRELLFGSRGFNDIRRGIPRISRTVLSERLKTLTHIGVIERVAGTPDYTLTPAGRELIEVVGALATWGQRWLPRDTAREDIDLGPVLVDMERRVRFDALPPEPIVVRFDFTGHQRQFMLLKRSEASICHANPGFPEPLSLTGKVAALAAWWRGDASFLQARRSGLALEGPRPMVNAFPTWFERYLFADIAPASADQLVGA